MTAYHIYPVIGVVAQKYLTDCGCDVKPGILEFPASLILDQQTGDVSLHDVILFKLKQMADKRWLVTVPRQYQDTFHMVLSTYGFNYQTASTILSLPETLIVDMLRDVPVPRKAALETLQRLSEYTGYPYSLENVRVEVHDD
jgi:hypothetical protein